MHATINEIYAIDRFFNFNAIIGMYKLYMTHRFTISWLGRVRHPYLVENES